MLVDTFLYNGERDFLDLRLCELQGQVDLFVAVVSNETFTGHKNPSYEFPFHPKLRIYTVKDMPFANPRNAMKREAHQRNSILKAISYLDDDAIVMVSDVDELPDMRWKSRIVSYLENQVDEHGNLDLTPLDQRVIVCDQDWYQFTLNTRVVGENSIWHGTRICKLGTLRRLYPQAVRNYHTVAFSLCGWHLSWMGGADMMRKKLDAYAHQYDLSREVGTINERIAHYWSHNYEFVAGTSHLPQCVQDCPEQYAKYFVYEEVQA